MAFTDEDDEIVKIAIVNGTEGKELQVTYDKKKLKEKAALELLHRTMPYRDMSIERIEEGANGTLRIVGKINEVDALNHPKQPRIFENHYSAHDFLETQNRIKRFENRDEGRIY